MWSAFLHCFGYVTHLLVMLGLSGTTQLVIQNKVSNGTVNFDQTWAVYREGFGVATLKDNYWLGNQVLNQLTSSAACSLQVRVRKL